MQRRAFIGLSLGGLVLGSTAYLAYIKPVKIAEHQFRFSGLPKNIQALYSSEFEGALLDHSNVMLLELLQEKSVFVNGQWHAENVAEYASSDRIYTHQNAPYSRTELALYALVARLRSRSWRRFYSPKA